MDLHLLKVGFYVLFLVKLMWISIISLNDNRVGYIIFYIRTASELEFSVFKSMEGVDIYTYSPCIAYNIDI
jgi:hypothetical protein